MLFQASSLLKNTRLDKEWDLTDISKKLKVPVKYLEALENGQIACYPEEPYCSLIIKDYADFLGEFLNCSRLSLTSLGTEELVVSLGKDYPAMIKYNNYVRTF